MGEGKKVAKKLQAGSIYDRFDLDGDGTITDEEMAKSKEILELELREEKADAQRRMSWIAISSMIIFTIVLFTPLCQIPELMLSQTY